MLAYILILNLFLSLRLAEGILLLTLGRVRQRAQFFALEKLCPAGSLAPGGRMKAETGRNKCFLFISSPSALFAERLSARPHGVQKNRQSTITIQPPSFENKITTSHQNFFVMTTTIFKALRYVE